MNKFSTVKTLRKEIMQFNSPQFLFIFLPIVITVYALISKFMKGKGTVSFLLFVSVLYYSWWDYRFLLLLFISVLFNFLIGRAVNSKPERKPALVVGILLNIFILGYFKYTNFFIGTLNSVSGSDFNLQNIILPLGISFFTFSQIAFLIDSFRGRTKEENFLDYALFVSFFPQITAGPIAYHREISPQLKNSDGLRFRFENLSPGFVLFCLGLFKKVVIADNLAFVVSPFFDGGAIDPENGAALIVPDLVNSWKAALAYTFQLYFDFSGYSDMAIGIAHIFGIKLPLNFNSPYKSLNIVEFWKRWHITLSRFFRDYVFLPVSFSLSRRLSAGSVFGSDIAIYSSGILVTWMLTGLWHGAGWTFVAWGVLHAFYLIINRILKKPRKRLLKKFGLSDKNWLMRICNGSFTFLAVVIAWVYFRSGSFERANEILLSMTGVNGIKSPSTNFEGYALIVLAAFITFILPNSREFLSEFEMAINTYGSELKKPRFNFLSFKYNFKFASFIAVILTLSALFVMSVQKMEFLYNDF
jgi:alginate O-acetyltransferase complex protein AlgI